jgi:hypothetical protein
MNNNVKINLHGQYRYSIIENGAVIDSIPWCNNTILSSGLVDLYDKSIDSLLSYLDLGLSSEQPGASGYGLSGVKENSVFVDIERDSIESYSDNNITRTFITSFTTSKSISSYTLKEFAIKRDKATPAFARNTFSESLVIGPDQYINFEYKLSLNWLNTSSRSLPVTGSSTSYTYKLPATSTNYNIPYYGVYSPNNYLLLLGDIYNADDTIRVDLPVQGENYPVNFVWGIQQQAYSTYKPTEIYKGIDQTTKTYNVTTRYENISCPLNSGVFSNIQYALLLHNNDFNIPANKFNITKFAYPLTIYNQYLSCSDTTDVFSNIPRYNNMSIDYNYSWTECTDVFLGDTDFLILTYEFATIDGSDLDIDVSLSLPVNTFPVGYCYISEYDSNDYPQDRDYIVWSGDNRGNGVESVYINIQNIKNNYPKATQVEINSLVKWWASRLNGDITIRATAWQGGVMELDTYQFYNIGGVMLNNFTFEPQNISSVGSECNNFESTGNLIYDITTGILTKQSPA